MDCSSRETRTEKIESIPTGASEHSLTGRTLAAKYSVCDRTDVNAASASVASDLSVWL